jgi:UDP-N-acetylglucosamine acyltransferase
MDFKHLQNIHPNAKIGNNVQIGPFVTIHEDVTIGDNTFIHPNVYIGNGVKVGANCKLFTGAIIGSDPQDLKYKGEETYLEIGDNTIVREYCTLNRGTTANMKTVVGSNCLLMAYVHIAHDCIVGDNVILANNVTFGGHVEVGDHAVIGGLTAVHQFVKIGAHSMTSGGSLVRLDIPPFITVGSEPLSYMGVNSTGLKRRNFTNEQINTITDIYRELFVKNSNNSNAIQHIIDNFPDTIEKELILQFVTSSERGVVKGFRTNSNK